MGIKRKQTWLSINIYNFNYTTYYSHQYILHGYSRYDKYNNSLWISYNGLINEEINLNDSELRMLLKLLSILNNNFYTTKNIIEGVYKIFNNEIKVIDNKDMTVTFRAHEYMTNMFITLFFNDLKPAPMGVGVNIEYY